MAHDNHNLSIEKFEPKSQLKTLGFALVAVGLISFIIGIIKAPDRMWTSYLVAFFFFSSLGLGGMFWVSVNNLSKAGWSVSIRRYAEAATSFIPIMIIASLLLLFGLQKLYPWARQEVIDASPLIAAKVDYLNTRFMFIRFLLFGLGVLVFKSVIVGNSLKQDKTGDEQLTHKNVAWSVGYIPFFALLFTLFSMDLLMSLLPTWYSTIFGIYTFAGMFQSFMAFLALVIIFMKNSGVVKGYVTVEHLHDVAKFMKGMTVFWAYIAFSQFMLIWYANIPEETEFFLLRTQNGWMSVSMALLVFRFIVPFIALLPRGAKRNEKHLIMVSVLILIMQYVDIYWLVYPNFNNGHIVFGFWEIGIFAGFAGLFMLAYFNFLNKNNVVAIKDPRMHEAINHHVTY